MIKLSKRLETISSLVPNESKVIDIGCDHGLLDIYLYQKKISNKIIASDINENALNNAKENIKKNKLDKIIQTRLGNGLETLKESDDIDTIIISGMGTHTIIDILKNNLNKLNKINTLIIQSNTKIELLRKSIIKFNYFIEDEEIIYENQKTYTIIKFTKGRKKYTKKELYFGPILLKKKSKLFKLNNKKELEKLNLILQKMPKKKIIDRYKIKKKINMYNNI